GGLVLPNLDLVLPDAFHGPGGGVVGAGLLGDDRLGMLGDFVQVRLDVLDEALGLVEGRVGLRLEPACELLITIRDKGGGQTVVHAERGLPAVAGGAESLVLFGSHARVEKRLLVLAFGDPDPGGLLLGKSWLPGRARFLRPDATGCDMSH